MRALLIPLGLVALCSAAHAGDISSAYTDLDWKKDCVTYAQAEEGDGDWASLACSGYRGYPVLVGYDDARESVYYGFPSDDMTAVWESFSAFNSSGAKVEWRIETKGDVAIPFAAIHRRSVSNPENENKPTEVLVVAKVAQPEKHEGCTIGLVLATGNAQANDQARKLADEKAKGFACGKDKREVIGEVPEFGRVDN
ncbi:hypothetical protein EN836_30585 [Mesorhizobium sp. M1C.F.Ca.ET.193.01.1.1]|uniref:hypothetical protein n=1 Tax=unclassified Mesorhizobium TaxID=325217 RepID=UPI000FD48692|nr:MULTISPECIES: hypothetical protein [unclassified Mesorhizobium]TGS92226.1 hypothetical protein EN820_51255 [bacterium M00.F.Ca.ET.177.01.1.1]TGQ50113.1 hypothetical protein EN853_30575 [Mesorhizobium sp. M1C.F.Ca.ET.210.01.1.1]TGQ64804.1 hypothetical protein EN855_030590 [Mesorhizobium sp. M1C.F.Ca.ET.212.01.1.1]TGQ98586.1 hypothetical protein EN847_30575 [Mesorhizobium sp. M1C.F.Ca.ET.204.01.1.1]TGR18778.1 hypothetical protein EN839_30575 [Mesorhizobium sp. M1C.F.Ca.ET.196.01.1.1]